MEKLTTEQANKLLKAIFADEKSDEDDNFPETVADKVGYSHYVLTKDLEFIGKAINRLNRLDRLLLVFEKSGALPELVLQNELRMALEHIMRVKGGIDEISEMLLEVYRNTKGK